MAVETSQSRGSTIFASTVLGVTLAIGVAGGAALLLNSGTLTEAVSASAYMKSGAADAEGDLSGSPSSNNSGQGDPSGVDPDGGSASGDPDFDETGSLKPAIDEDVAANAETDWVRYISWGDTLSQISAETGVSVERLAEYNAIVNVDLIYADSSLRVPYVLIPMD